MNVINLVESENYIEFQKALHEKLISVQQKKLLEVKKMVAAGIYEGDDKPRVLKFKVTHQDGDTTEHSVEVPKWGHPYPEFLQTEIKKQLKDMGKPTTYKKVESNDENPSVYRDAAGRTSWVDKKSKEKK